ncbi:MAG: response regulator transcription factor [Planctomycetota bacterium]|nr:MAG: response regulator transcription factor [Planctomycetota bacterium]
MAQRLVLVVEDDPAIRRGLADALGFGGYKVIERGDGPGGLEAALGAALDLVVLDVLLPGKDGFAVLAELRRLRPTLPVILVTAKGAEDDRVHGLKLGADDYVVKPFSAREVLARVEAVLRRSAERPGDVRVLQFAGRRVDLDRREVLLPSGATRQLSDREAEILRYLAGNRRRAVSREELLRCVWGLDPRGIQTRAVDMHVARLREKLGDDPEQARVILTVRNRGYMLGADRQP